MSKLNEARLKEIRTRVWARPGESSFDPAYMYKNTYQDGIDLLAHIDALQGEIFDLKYSRDALKQMLQGYLKHVPEKSPTPTLAEDKK